MYSRDSEDCDSQTGNRRVAAVAHHIDGCQGQRPNVQGLEYERLVAVQFWRIARVTGNLGDFGDLGKSCPAIACISA